MTTTVPALTIRPTTARDGAALWRLARDAEGLELNTPYCYVLAADELGDTCLVAEEDGAPLGFVLALRPPRRPQTVFVWQVGVSRAARGRGLGRRLLSELVRRPSCGEVTHLEATVTAANAASRALFRSFARSQGARCEVTPRYEPGHFPEDGHEAEELFRIGPLSAPARCQERS
jgi:L-2,4-diaminobutyric acid acetyltransferase